MPPNNIAPHKSATMFANRLKKNLRHLKRWIKRENIDCYRLYDADLPDYALAIDIYECEQRYVHVQEYQAPKYINEQKTQQRLNDALLVIRDVLSIEQTQLFLKIRRQQKGNAQYEKLAERKNCFEVNEGGCRFLVNFEDYLDTGLFLDHRITRGLLAELASNRHFLNLFAYTGSATVYAAKGGAATTTTVDMSKTYLRWAQQNMHLNGFNNTQHYFIQADCIEWLDQRIGKDTFDLIFLDPPTFSTSKRMQSTFDVQRDHVMLLKKTAKLLTPDGILFFSNNLRHFSLDDAALSELDITELSKTTLPMDFARRPNIHHCWKMRRL